MLVVIILQASEGRIINRKFMTSEQLTWHLPLDLIIENTSFVQKNSFNF
jgi:hypothetical protein